MAHIQPAAHASFRPPRTRRNRRGMTMAEVLIAATLLAFVIMSSLTALSQAYALTHHARMITLAGQIAQSVMEDLRLRNFDELCEYAEQSQPVDFTSKLATERFSSSFVQGFAISGQFTTVVVSAPPQIGKLTVTLTVTWSERGSNFSRVLVTHFAERGLSDYYYVGWAP